MPPPSSRLSSTPDFTNKIPNLKHRNYRSTSEKSSKRWSSSVPLSLEKRSSSHGDTWSTLQNRLTSMVHGHHPLRKCSVLNSRYGLWPPCYTIVANPLPRFTQASLFRRNARPLRVEESTMCVVLRVWVMGFATTNGVSKDFLTTDEILTSCLH